MVDALGDRMKAYEAQESGRRFIPLLPVYARIDGRGFSSFTQGMDRPFDKRMSDAMIETTKGLVDKTHARIGFTQSDEISLAWLADDYSASIFFEGKVLKMTSVLAGLATALFTAALRSELPEYAERLPHFDCRVVQFPNKVEAANMFLWRELDATKNAVSMAARSVYSHRELHGKSGPEMQEMLFAKGINFNDYPAFFKRGSFVRRITVERTLTDEEIARIPGKFTPARDALVRRSELRVLDVPKFSTVSNRPEVIFDGAEPVV